MLGFQIYSDSETPGSELTILATTMFLHDPDLGWAFPAGEVAAGPGFSLFRRVGFKHRPALGRFSPRLSGFTGSRV